MSAQTQLDNIDAEIARTHQQIRKWRAAEPYFERRLERLEIRRLAASDQLRAERQAAIDAVTGRDGE